MRGKAEMIWAIRPWLHHVRRVGISRVWTPSRVWTRRHVHHHPAPLTPPRFRRARHQMRRRSPLRRHNLVVASTPPATVPPMRRKKGSQRAGSAGAGGMYVLTVRLCLREGKGDRARTSEHALTCVCDHSQHIQVCANFSSVWSGSASFAQGVGIGAWFSPVRLPRISLSIARLFAFLPRPLLHAGTT